MKDRAGGDQADAREFKARQAREKYFPGSFMYESLDLPPEAPRPFYRVITTNQADFEEAIAHKPKNVRAEIILQEPVK